MKRNALPVLAMWLILFCVFSGSETAFAVSDCPPDPVDIIFWDEDPTTPGNLQTYAGVEAIENAFNNARRIEEIQLGLLPGQFGTLDLPAQPVWDQMTDDARALFIINDERMVRADPSRGINGLPLAGIESHIDENAAWYGDYLYLNNWTAQDDPDYFTANSPFQRIDENPDLGESYAYGACHEYLHYAENLAYFAEVSFEGPPPLPMPLERAIYGWIYEDLYSGWSHRRALLMQHRTLDYPDYEYGYKNNRGESTSEGYLGIYVRKGPHYNAGAPMATDRYYTGAVVVMDIFDPIADWAERNSDDHFCRYNPEASWTAAFAPSGPAVLHHTVIPDNQWMQVSLGGEPNGQENTVAWIFGDDLPAATYGTEWILFAYDPAVNRYRTLGLNDELEPKVAYWILQRTGAPVLVDMPASASEAYTQYCNDADCTNPYPCSSPKGCMLVRLATSPDHDTWQMIGQPSRSPVPLDQIRVWTKDGLCVNGCDLETARIYHVVSDQFWYYNGTNYVAPDALAPWQGVWVMAGQTEYMEPVLVLPLP